uniref:Uncharacterized protein n=1 Tax=Neisseria meningitidis alpha153 TaxID=663926 RepID=C6SAB9_NEIME|nr:hypothetical protein predicted by Glimmer/Critica [Neisseria meningitidis alpha153]
MIFNLIYGAAVLKNPYAGCGLLLLFALIQIFN